MPRKKKTRGTLVGGVYLSKWQIKRFMGTDGWGHANAALRLLPLVYVGYAWSYKHTCWMLLGFVRMRSEPRMRHMAKLRRRFTLPNHTPLRMIELFVAAACPPQNILSDLPSVHLTIK